MERRIFELEKKVTFLEKYVDELNSVVIEQGKELIRLKKYASSLEERLATAASPLLEDRPHLEKPPHY